MKLITPNWNAPTNIKAFCSTRDGGVSTGSFNSLNLGAHVGDDLAKVTKNRELFEKTIKSPAINYLRQTHSFNVATETSDLSQEFDAIYTNQKGFACAVLTADCLPVLLTTTKGDEVAAVHAGWRGLCAGVIEHSVSKFNAPRSEIMAYLAPAISQLNFEVGQEVLDSFCRENYSYASAFRQKANTPYKYMADLYLIATMKLNDLGINKVFKHDYCTMRDQDLFYSYRHSQTTGRQASVIWIDK